MKLLVALHGRQPRWQLRGVGHLIQRINNISMALSGIAVLCFIRYMKRWDTFYANDVKISYIEIGAGRLHWPLVRSGRGSRATNAPQPLSYIHINVTIFHNLIHMEISKQLVKMTIVAVVLVPVSWYDNKDFNLWHLRPGMSAQPVPDPLRSYRHVQLFITYWITWQYFR